MNMGRRDPDERSINELAKAFRQEMADRSSAGVGMRPLLEEKENPYKKIDLELVQDSPAYAAELIGRYRENQEILVGALKLIADDETDWPQQLAQNVLDKVLGADDA